MVLISSDPKKSQDGFPIKVSSPFLSTLFVEDPTGEPMPLPGGDKLNLAMDLRNAESNDCLK